MQKSFSLVYFNFSGQPKVDKIILLCTRCGLVDSTKIFLHFILIYNKNILSASKEKYTRDEFPQQFAVFK